MSKILIKAYGRKDIGKLVPRMIIDKNGNAKRVWIKPSDIHSTESFSPRLHKRMESFIVKRAKQGMSRSDIADDLSDSSLGRELSYDIPRPAEPDFYKYVEKKHKIKIPL